MSAPGTASRQGDWIQTYTLRQFWPADPRGEDVDVRDIAHALSMICRFTGHVHSFYSVAEHCVRVSWLAEFLAPAGQQHVAARWGLLHDADEAYLMDIARPVKRLPELAPYRAMGERLLQVVCERFGLPEGEPDEVREADRRLLYTEARDLFTGHHPAWQWHAEPLPERIRPWTQPRAKAAFLARFVELFPEDGFSKAISALKGGAR